MHIVVVGGGGREHALAWKLRQSPLVKRISITAPNFATAQFADVAPSDVAALTDFCRKESVSLTVIGPEAPLAEGMADSLRTAGIAALGPSQAAAKIESSKIFAKELMQKCGIRTADFAIANSVSDAEKWCAVRRPPFVLKADGLAAGKGVVICESEKDAVRSAKEMLDGKFGAASARILLEEHLRGREMSFIALTDGINAIPLASSRDYKRLGTGNAGPNTGGMGAISPAPESGDNLRARIMDEIIHPALCGMRESGAPFCGFLYAGLMLDGDDIYALEFNCRLGDPETQAILPRWRGDCLPAFLAAANGDLSGHKIEWRAQTATGIVFAAAGYPENPRKGDAISLPDSRNNTGDGAFVFHAGTMADANGNPMTSGGRVLSVVALGEDLADAKNRAYSAAATIRFDGMQFRKDIGE